MFYIYIMQNEHTRAFLFHLLFFVVVAVAGICWFGCHLIINHRLFFFCFFLIFFFFYFLSFSLFAFFFLLFLFSCKSWVVVCSVNVGVRMCGVCIFSVRRNQVGWGLLQRSYYVSRRNQSLLETAVLLKCWTGGG